MVVLKRRSSSHPGLRPLGRIARGLPEEAPARTSMTMRLRGCWLWEIGPYLSMDAGVYLDGIVWDAHDGFRRRYSGLAEYDRAGANPTAYKAVPTTRRARRYRHLRGQKGKTNREFLGRRRPQRGRSSFPLHPLGRRASRAGSLPCPAPPVPARRISRP